MDTSGETCESFNFVLNHYNVPFSNSRKHRLYLCNNGHLIAIVDNAGNVFIRDLYSSEVLKLSDEPSARVCWQQPSEIGLKQDDSAQMVILSQQGHLYMYTVGWRESVEDGVSHLAVMCNTQCHYLTLKHILQDVGIDYHRPQEDCGFLCCHGNRVTLTCGSTVVRLQVQKDQPPEVRSNFMLPDMTSLMVIKPYQPDLVMMLNGNKEVVFWSIERGVKVAYIRLEDVLGIATQPSLCVSLTEDWQYLLVLTPGSLNIVSLHCYFETYPDNISVKQMSHEIKLTAAHGLNVSHTKDSVWTAKLAKVKKAADFGSTHVFDELAWFEKAGLKPAAAMNVPSAKASSDGMMRRRHKVEVCEELVRHVVLGAWSDKMSLKDVCGGSQLTYILLQDNSDDEQDILIAVQVMSGQTAVHRLPRHSAAILSPSVLSPAMAVTSDTLYAIVFHTQQELVVNRLMLYESASMADVLCGLNGWNQCCLAMPVLEMALKHRQLDTIAFFLKSRESVFCLHKSTDGSEQGDDLEYDYTDLEQLDMVMEQLKAAIREHIVDCQLRHYAEQLLLLTMEYLHKISHNVVTRLQQTQTAGVTDDQFEMASTHILSQLSNYVVELREHMNTRTLSLPSHNRHMKARDTRQAGQQGGAEAFQMTQAQKEMVHVWDQLDLKAAVVEGIQNQEIPLLQTYVLSRFSRDASLLSNVIRLGLEEALALLCEREWKYATKMLQNMGFHVPTKLREICYYTTKKLLRDYIAARLQQKGHMTAEELQTLDYMHQIEQMYSCTSFEMAKLLRTEGTFSHWEEEIVMVRNVMVDASCTKGAALQQICGEIAPVDMTNSETTSYIHLLLEWVTKWDMDTQQCIVLEQGFNRKDVNQKLLELPAAVVWKYLCGHHHLKPLLTWIECAFTEETSWPAGSTAVASQHAWPYNMLLDVSVIDSALITCPAYLTDILLDALASHGILCDTELWDMQLLVKRLTRITGIIQQPHLVECRPDTHSVHILDLHKHLIQWFITNSLPQLLWFYLDYWQLCETDYGVATIGQDKDWMQTLLCFRKLSRRPLDLQCMLRASVTTEGLELESLVHTLNTMVEQGAPLGALATLTFSSHTLHQLVERRKMTERMSTLLSQFPRLQRAFFPVNDISSDVPASSPDVTVYSLLQGNTAFDLSRLFGWQNTNSLATEDSLKELLHFSQESLMLRYARTDTLGFMYFLKLGRPSFAFGTFVASQLTAGVKLIRAKLIHSACKRCHWLALKYFHQSHIGAACTAFAEMLGHDSTVIRIHLEAANEIYTHRCSCEASGDIEQRKETEKFIQQQTATLLQGCARHQKKSTESALVQLKAATRWHLEKHQIKCLTLAAGQKWLLPLIFCKCHQMALPTDFLCNCALHDDWLMFLTYSQLYQFPRSQLKDILHKFVSAHIKEHLQYVLENVTVDGGQQPRLDVPTRDVRAQLYARIGVKNAVHSTPHNGSSSSEDADGESEDEDSEEEGEEADMLIPVSQQGLIPHVDFTDLFDLLFVCNALSAPWRTLCAYAIHLHNPVLAVLAACYHGHSTIWCLCSWLHASLSEESDKTGLDRSIKEWTLEDLSELVRVILASCRVPLLHIAFTIFQPTCELLSFLEFYLSFMQHASEEKCMGHLVRFKEACEQKHHSCDDDSVPMSWVEDMVVTIIRYCLQHVSCVSSTHTLLTLLDHADVTCSFTVPVPPVGHLHRLHELTHDTPVTLNYAVLSDYAHPHYNALCRHSLHQLLTHQLFDVARQFADVTGLPSDHITIQQLHSELSALQTSDMWKQLETRVVFWRKCYQLMAKDHTPPLVAAVFYQDQATVCPTHLERGYLYQLAYDWLSRDKDGATTTPDSEQMNKMFIQLWKCKIQDCIENGKNDNSRCHLFRQGHKERTVTQESLFRCIQTPTVASVSTVRLTQQEKAALDTLLGGLLDECHIADVIRVTSCFGHVSEDLDVVTSCMKLAIGTVCVSDLTPSVKKLLAVPRLHRRHTSTSMVALPRCLSTVSIGTLAALNRESDDNSGDTIQSTMQLLCLRCSHGKQCCTQIIVLYKIAKVLELSLLEVVDLEQFALLRRLLATEHAHKYVHAKSFITTSGLTDPQVAGFLCDGILSALQVHAGIVAPAMTSDGTSIPLLLGNPSKKQTCGIGELVQLCGSPSVMGQRLLDSGMALLSSSHDLSHKLLWVVVELLIYAHDCHTLACNMEGICAVLHGCRSVTTSLSLADEYNLMIHLLTGIGRFSEMTYVFDMLKQKHQFELLFRKGIEREDKLKVAILDYLKRSHPADTDTLTMVSLHYMLYRQIAQALEERAQGLLSTFSTKTLVNTPDVTSKLHKALQYLSDAAETYTKEQCLRHAEHCVKQARLVALQIHLLPTRAQVLHLSPEGVKAFVTTHHKFYEAYIVCCAYSDHNYWGDAVYQQVIERADSKYLSDLRAHVPLTGSLVEDVVERYRTTSAANMTVPVHMKKLLCCCPDIQTAYRLATELGFSDTVHDLLGGERGNYLQDIIM